MTLSLSLCGSAAVNFSHSGGSVDWMEALVPRLRLFFVAWMMIEYKLKRPEEMPAQLPFNSHVFLKRAQLT